MSGGPPDELTDHWGEGHDIAGGATAADEDRALHTLTLAWGDQYDELWVCDGRWGAHREGDPDLDGIIAATPDELNRAIREREGTR